MMHTLRPPGEKSRGHRVKLEKGALRASGFTAVWA